MTLQVLKDDCARCGNARESHYQSKFACLCANCECPEYVAPIYGNDGEGGDDE